MKRALILTVFLFATFLLASPRESIGQDQGVSMIFASDTQYPWWRTAQDPNCNTEECIETMALQTNTRFIKAMRSITTIGQWPKDISCQKLDSTSSACASRGGQPVTKPSGLIINGDLTAYFHAHQFFTFGGLYYIGLLAHYQIYPGLGNHDYKNNVDNGPDSGSFWSWGVSRYNDGLVYAYDWNRNAKEAVWFMANQMEVMPNIVNKDVSAFVSLENKGGFVARLRVDIDLNGARNKLETESFEVTQRRGLVIPREATNVDVQIQEWTGFGWKVVNSYHYDRAVRACFEVTGTTFDPDSATTPCIQEWPSGSYGSLSYSFEIGDFHFVQLQYRPDYRRDLPEKTVTGPITTYKIDESPGFTVTPSYTWLKKDLAAATAAGKFIVLNMHDVWLTDCDECNPQKTAVKDDPEFLKAIAHQNVVAIFAGHIHDSSGLKGYVESEGDEGVRRIPIFLSGSAEYERFLIGDFHRKYFTVASIDSSSGQPVVTANRAAFEINRSPKLTGASLETDPALALEGSSLSFRAEASDPDGDEVTVNWQFGDNETATGLNPVHTYADNGVYSVTVDAVDGYGGKATKKLTVTVKNVSPKMTAQGMTIDENQVATVSGTITDPGTKDTFDLTIDWRDGSPVETFAVGTDRSYSRSHQYLDDNPTGTPSDLYAIHLTILDKDQGSGAGDTAVTVRNLGPTTHIDSILDDAGQEVGPSDLALVSLALTSRESYSDPGTQDVLRATRSWGDATPVEDLGVVTATMSGIHVYEKAGTYQPVVIVNDDDAGVSSWTRPVHVATPAGATSQAIDDLARATTSQPAAAKAVDDALKAVNGALQQLDKGNDQAALEKLEQTIRPLETAEAADPALHFTKLKSLVTLTSKSVAVDAISRAEAKASNNGQRKQVAAAKDLLAQGQSLLVNRDYAGAIKSFREILGKTSFAKNNS